MSNQNQEKLPYIQTYIYAFGCLKKKIDEVNIYFFGCQMVEKPSTCGIAKWSPRKIVSPSVFFNDDAS